MALKDFAKSLDLVLVHEGGYINHPKDPGGPTNKGVTQRVYDLYRRAKGLKARSVKEITKPEILDVYKTRYWDAVKGDQLPAGVDYVVFDGGVNSGPVQSGKWLQRALGDHYRGKVDGQIGPSTIAAVAEHPNHDALVAAICANRLAFLKALKGWSTFKGGWRSRVENVLDIGQAWATGGTLPKAMFFEGGNAKGLIENARGGPVKAPADAATGGGLITTAIAQATDQLTPLADIEFVGKLVAILTVAGVVVFLGGIGWRQVAQYRARRRAEALDLPAV